MKRLIDPKILLLLLIPFMLGFAPFFHDDGKGIGNASPPGIGGVGPWDSMNMDLLSHLPIDQIGGGQANVIGSDCWGWTDPLDGTEYAICGLTNATSFIDISDPINPKYLGKLPTQTGNKAWRDMKVYNNHVFVVSDGNGAHGMQVFDLTQLRTADRNNPTIFSNTAWYSGVETCHNIAINEDSGYAYLVGCNVAAGGLHVVDISNPSNPVAAGEFAADGYTHDAQIVNYAGPDTDYAGKEIAFACNEDTLTIVDVTNKNNMVQISRNTYAEDEYTHQGWLSADQRYFYMCDELDESRLGGPTRTHVFDCLDLDNPVYLGYHSGSSLAIDHNLYIQGNMIYLASYSAGLRCLEIGPGGPLDLTEVAYFDTYNTDTDTDFDGAWSCYPYYDSGTVLVNDRQNGMFLVRLSPLNFEFPQGHPEFIDPQGGVELTIQVVDVFDTAQAGTGMLHVMRGQGIENFPMNEISPGLYEANFPTSTCGEEVRYFFTVQTTGGETIYHPTNAPMSSYSAISAADVSTNFFDDFELDLGWTVSGDATDGHWERGVPVGGGVRGDPAADGDGSGSCYLTDNVAGNSDVDGGSTILTSPMFDATGSNVTAALISYHSWFSNTAGSGQFEDSMLVEISNDNGETWVTLETIGPSGQEVAGGWYPKTFFISDFVTPTNQMQLRFTASDLGNGSVVEAGVDGVQVRLVHCATDALPLGLNVIIGSVNSGGVPELIDSDDQHAVLDPQFLTSRYQLLFTVDATSPYETPSALEFKLESKVFNFVGTVQQRIELLNYNTGQFETVDTRLATSTDTVVSVIPGGDPSRFVQAGTSAMQARIRYQNSLPYWVTRTANLYLPFRARVDQTIWAITP